jgi:acyl carrier protein
MSDISEKVKHLISKHLSRPLEELKDTDSFTDDLGADSLDSIELVLAFEDEFQIEIPDDISEGIITVGDAIKCIETATAVSAAIKD